MENRAGESDVRAMAAALTERQVAPEKPPLPTGTGTGSNNVHLSILDENKNPLTGDLKEGMVLYASIRIEARDTGTLYIGAVELANVEKPGSTIPQQLFLPTADCVWITAFTRCKLSPQVFEGDYLQFSLKEIESLIAGNRYSFNLLYSETEEALGSVALKTITAMDPNGGEGIFRASSNDSSAGPASDLKISSTAGVDNEPTTITQPSKPNWTAITPDSPTTTPAATVPTDISADVASSSASSKGLSTGAKAGIGVGVAAAVLIVIALLVAWWVRRSRRASSRNGHDGGAGEKESVLAAAAPGGAGAYRDADEAGGGVLGGSPVTRKPVGLPVTNEAALADAVSPASTTVGVVGGQSRGPGGEGAVASRESMLNAEERERWEEEERRLDEDIAEAERRRLGA